ncbi:GIY-YIG nuclease family protein [Pedobacter superstes]|uniref:GIY-YIG nuclease family protein n=1 Tax=Pedobacter superstes TaxID=3133441 RepID=UPI003D707E95
MANVFNTVLYIGVTSDLFSRITDHKNKKYPDSFTAKYNCNKLVYYEMFPSIEEAIGKEKQLKKWKREWKDKLIQDANPGGWICLLMSCDTRSITPPRHSCARPA